MKRALVVICGLVCASTAQAQYAFGQPDILAAQRLWGIVHGARLLAQACSDAGQGEAAEAWVVWHEREMPHILNTGRVLARHHFGAEDAPPDALSAVLGLKPALVLPAEALEPACATLAEALAQPRYDLARRHEEFLKAEPTKPPPAP